LGQEAPTDDEEARGQAAGGGGLILLSSSVPEAPLAAIPAPTACCVRWMASAALWTVLPRSPPPGPAALLWASLSPVRSWRFRTGLTPAWMSTQWVPRCVPNRWLCWQWKRVLRYALHAM